MLYDFEYDSYNWIIENVKLDFLAHSESFVQRKKSEYEKPFHSHVYYELLFSTADDTAEFFYNNKRITLSKNDFVITSPYYSHRAVIKHEENLFSFGFLFKQNNQKEKPRQDLFALLNDAFSQNDCIIGRGDESLLGFCRQLRQYSDMPDAFGEGCLVASFLLVLFHILRYLKVGEHTGGCEFVRKAPEGARESGRSTRIPSEIASTINNLLSDSFTTDVTPEEISKTYYISPKQINRYIYNQYGKTFMQRKTQLRMNYALKLLRESDLAIEEISEKVGYHSINSFYSAFKVYFGITPNRCRMGDTPAAKD